MAIPVLLMAFNRAEPTRQVCEAIRVAQPTKVYVACDGPRAQKPSDAESCSAVRRLVSDFDFGCKKELNFQGQNLGCRGGVAAAIKWFFGREEEGAVLEDDIVPDPAFLPFCEALLDRYRRDTRIWSIAGINPVESATSRIEGDYFYSRYFEVWGWASWRSRWSNYDSKMANWPRERARFRVGSGLTSRLQTPHFRHLLDATYSGLVDTWDYQRIYEQIAGGGLSVVPKHWLVKNIGFSKDATHTTRPPQWLSEPRGWTPHAVPRGPEEAISIEEWDYLIGRVRYGAVFSRYVKNSVRRYVLRLRGRANIPGTNPDVEFGMTNDPE
ncbi:MAG: hypothetical protein IPM60_05755 [Rhodospirillales bacterium]|nr:hypothetical protein [Rhodospirillales bacterium]